MRTPGLVCALFALVLLAPTGGHALQATDPRVAELDAFVQQAMIDYGVPGTAVGVVLDGQTILRRGYGVRRLGEATPVDAETVFQLASVTKSFTAAALGALVDEGRLAWDDPVINSLPELVLHDPYPTRYATTRDLLAHRSGLPAFGGDLLGQLGYDRAEVLRRVRFIEPTHSFRDRAGYSNIGYFLAGEVAARNGDSSWEQVIRSRLLAPLGMSRSGTSIAEPPADGNWAASHAVVDGRLQVVPWEGSDVLGAAGAMTSSAADVLHFLEMLLAGGRFAERQVLGSATVESLFQPSMVSEIGFAELPPISVDTGFDFTLGWGVYHYQGYRVLEKGGALGGVRTIIMLLPEKQLGVVVLANRNLTALPEAIRARVLESFVGPAGRDVQREIRERQARFTALFEPAEPPPSPGPLSLPLDAYTGTYENDVYGRFVVVRDGDALRMAAGPGGYPGTLTHSSRDTFALQWPSVTLTADQTTFTVGPEGQAVQFETEALGRFRRVAADPATVR